MCGFEDVRFGRVRRYRRVGGWVGLHHMSKLRAPNVYVVWQAVVRRDQEAKSIFFHRPSTKVGVPFLLVGDAVVQHLSILFLSVGHRLNSESSPPPLIQLCCTTHSTSITQSPRAHTDTYIWPGASFATTIRFHISAKNKLIIYLTTCPKLQPLAWVSSTRTQLPPFLP